MKRLVCILLACLLLVAAPVVAQTRAWLDRTDIREGEMVTLIIETDQPTQAIDMAPLQGQFELGGQSVRRSVAWNNGSRSLQTVFSVGLRPRAAGAYTLPALQVGKARTAPLGLQVRPAPVAAADGSADVFIETEVDTEQPYVQQAVAVVLRLHYAVPLLSGQLDLPAPQGASLRQVGEDRTYLRLLGGRQFHVVERRFLLIPDRSGPLLLPGGRFNGVKAGGTLDAIFDDGRQPIAAAAQARRLQVRPIPDEAAQPWLPLRDLQLRYLQRPTQARQGQAVTVEVELMADGATAAQLPDLAWPSQPGVQVFAEPPQTDEQLDEGRPRTRLRRSFSLVPARAGTLSLAGPRIAWWDAVSGRPREAMLPALQLAVAAAATAGGKASVLQAPAAMPAVGADKVPPSRTAAGIRVALWLSPLLLLLAILGVWRWRASPALPTGAGSRRALGLADALQSGNLERVASALVQAMGLAEEDFDAVQAQLEVPEQRQAVHLLQSARWGGGDRQTAIAALCKAFARGVTCGKTKQKAASLLPPLYPEQA